MEFALNPVEARVLGCLIEKELTTPEYYPLSLNALTSACNQKSNRDPVMALEEPDQSPRELAVRFTDTEKYFVSESSVYRLLKSHDLITRPALDVMISFLGWQS